MVIATISYLRAKKISSTTFWFLKAREKVAKKFMAVHAEDVGVTNKFSTEDK